MEKIEIHSTRKGGDLKDVVDSQNEDQQISLTAQQAPTSREEITMKSMFDYLVSCRNHVDLQFDELQNLDDFQSAKNRSYVDSQFTALQNKVDSQYVELRKYVALQFVELLNQSDSQFTKICKEIATFRQEFITRKMDD
ncbi:hypothetical protein V6N12_045074 [Hibiscus sabdariffa]|uniref:Uncharacterized protein n=1 Tax=Hibiscus sabdariffa TaxID=183260 RepID=A0ABR2G1X5_9ROSI